MIDVLYTVFGYFDSLYVQLENYSWIFSLILGIMLCYLGVYAVIGLFFTRKFKPTDNLHKYAIVIPARNEEAVIGNLLDSIKAQDYPAEYISVFVIADNCTDKTAEIARQKGAVCYERFDTQRRTKGYALQFLFEKIREDYGIDSFEGYFVFDSDNLLNTDYISRMNEAFDSGEKIITSYRNTKNFDENWIAFSYAIHWLRSIRFHHRARSLLRLATNIQGTGFLFANELVKDGWKYTSLTEDRAFTADAVAHGYSISYCDAAVFYDEQPVSLRVALRQRLRWSKGHLLAFAEVGPALFKNIFVGNCYKDKSKKEPLSRKRILEGIRLRWASYDILVQCFPAAVVKTAFWIIFTVLIFGIIRGFYGIEDASIFGNNPLGTGLSYIFPDLSQCNLSPGVATFWASVGIVFLKNALARIYSHIISIFMSSYLLITERKRIIKMPLYKKILYSVTWPVFDAIGRWTSYIALFKKIEWKPIPHNSKVTIDSIINSTGDTAKMDEQKKEVYSKENTRVSKLNILMLILPFFLIDCVIRLLTIEINYLPPQSIFPSIAFTGIWVAFMVRFSLMFKGRVGRIVYGLFFALFFIMCLTHLIYFQYTDFIFSFSLMDAADEGASYIWDTIKGTNILTFVVLFIILATGVWAIVKFPKREKTEWKHLGITFIAFLLIRFLVPLTYGGANDALKWDTWRNPRNVYNSFGDSNKSIKVSGIYEYTIRDFYVTFLRPVDEINPEEEKFLKEAYSENKPHEVNSCTGIFKGKNVIVLQLEGIDSWLLNENDMPNLHGMLNNSMIFHDHYSYYTGGGSTFNSELAVTTGYVTPISYAQNAYLFHTNTYPNTLPKLFKQEGYVANAFHMNSGEFYMRNLNYKNWGYDNYYSLVDDCDYDDMSYQLDTELVNNEFFYDKMFKQDKPFLNYVITYTPHTPFSLDSDVGEALCEKLYPNGETIPELGEEEVARMFATETDEMIGLMLKALEDNDLIDNTVIVAFADHYLYTLNDKTILDKHKRTDNNLINKTPFIIWSKDMPQEHVYKTNSQLDILPTVLNLFGINFNDEYYIGRDVWDPQYGGYVFFSDYSWYDGYNYVEYGEVVEGPETDPQRVEETNERINYLIRKNDLTLKYNYLKNTRQRR